MAVAVVTGAGVRVGRAIALALARDGFDIVVHANKSLSDAKAVGREVALLGRRAYIEQADLLDGDAIEALGAKLAQDHGAIDVLVNSAAAFNKVPFADITRAQYDQMRGLNLDAPFFLTQRLLPALAAASDPCVINIVDMALERPMNGYAHYSVSKGGLATLTRALAVELAPKIRVNGVAPGPVAFPASFSEEQRRDVVKRVPLAREGSPDDVADAVSFLVKSRYITGVILPVDGGRTVSL